MLHVKKILKHASDKRCLPLEYVLLVFPSEVMCGKLYCIPGTMF